MDPMIEPVQPGGTPYRPGFGRPRVSAFRIGVVAAVVVAFVVAWFIWAARPMIVVAPGEDFAAWVGEQAVMMTMTQCTSTSTCKAPVLQVKAGDRVRLGFRSSSPLSLVTDTTTLSAAIDPEGWYLDTTDLEGRTLVGVVGGDANMWQVIIKVAS